MDNVLNAFHVRMKNRGELPMHTLRGYRLRAVSYGQGDIPLERREVDLPDTTPGSEALIELKFVQTDVPLRVSFDVLRPTGFFAYSLDWKP